MSINDRNNHQQFNSNIHNMNKSVSRLNQIFNLNDDENEEDNDLEMKQDNDQNCSKEIWKQIASKSLIIKAEHLRHIKGTRKWNKWEENFVISLIKKIYSILLHIISSHLAPLQLLSLVLIISIWPSCTLSRLFVFTASAIGNRSRGTLSRLLGPSRLVIG